MADRSVTVKLRAETSQYKAAMAAAAAETQAFARTAESSGKDIDKYSGRLRAVADAALTLGPALIPIGAAAIPAITAGLAGLGAAAGGLGVAVLAVQGLGDGLKALDAYQLAPTTANFQKMRVEMEKLGPAGAEFVHFLDGLEPQLSNLQQIARAGLFPGVEDGITSLLTRLPQVQRIVADLAQGMGDLAAEAGDNLAGGKFDAFFNYLETDARPTLEAFAHAAGNVAEGVANIIVGFAPLNRDFTKGLEGATEAFAKWSRGLDQNKSFQDFLSYIRESGPQVAQLLGSVASAFAGIVKAAAPMGQVVLPALSAMAKAFAAVANSPIGPPLYTAAAGLIAFNRAASLSGGLADKMAASFSNLGLQAETTKGKLANIGLAAGAAALALGTVSDAQEILNSRSRSNNTLDATVKSLQDLQDTVAGSNLSKYAQDLHIDIPRLTDDLAKNGSAGEYVQQVQKQLADSSHGVGAAFNSLAGNILPFYTAGADKAYDANKDLKTIMGELGNGLGKAPGLFGGVIDSLQRATSAAHDLSGALAELSGWFDKREAVRNYRDSVDELSKSIKNGFSRKDVENLDNVGRNILQVAQSIKNPALQHDFLQGARKSLEGLASTAGPKAAAAIQRVIDKMDDSHLTHPPHPKLDVDNQAANSKIDDTSQRLRKYGNTVTVSKVDANASAAMGVFNAVQHMLSALDGDTATTYVRTVHQNVFPAGGGRAIGGNADGGLITGPGGPRDDRILARLSNKEYVVKASAVAKYGVHMMDAINAERFADGGSAGGRSGRGGGGTFATVWTDGVYSAAKALKAFKAELDASAKAIDREKTARDNAISTRNDFMSSVGGAYSQADLFSGGLSNFDTGLAANTNDTNAANAALAAAHAHGLDGPLYQALAKSGNLQLLQEFAGLSSDQIQIREQQFAAQSNAQGALGTSAAADAGMTQAVKDATKELHESQREHRHLAQVVKSLEAEIKKMGQHVEDGARRGNAEKDKRTHTRTRTG